MRQDKVSDKLGLTGECKRRTITRYENEERNPKDERTTEIARILNVSYNAIKKYYYKNPLDVVYILMWLEELLPSIRIELSDTRNLSDQAVLKIKKGIHEWKMMKRNFQRK